MNVVRGRSQTNGWLENPVKRPTVDANMVSESNAEDSGKAHDRGVDRAALPSVRLPVNPRLWPAVLIVIAQLALMFGPGLAAPGGVAHFLGLVSGPAIGTLLLVMWWLLASRLPWRERLVGLSLVIGVALAAHFWADRTMKSLTPFYLLPLMSTSVVVVLVLTRRSRVASRRCLALVTSIVTAGLWLTVRVDGLTGSMQPQFAWRWTRTAEQKLLAETVARDSLDGQPLRIPTPFGPGDWPGFRGPARDGRVVDVEFGTEWDRRPPRELWRRRVGPAWSSFAVIGNLAFTQEQRGKDECVVCYHADTGGEIWVNRVAARFYEVSSGPGPRATPSFHDGRLYTLGATGVLQCLDPATGTSMWIRKLVDDTGAKMPLWAFSSSPLTVDGLVIIFAGGPDGKSVVAYDHSTGEPVWSNGQGTLSYSSPHLARIAEEDQVLMCSDVGLHGYGLTTGDFLWGHDWRLRGMGRIVQPLVFDDSVIIGTGYGLGSRRLDVRRRDGLWSAREVWTSARFRPYFNDFVYHDGYLYGFNGRVFTCIDADSGKPQWKGGRYGNGQVLLVVDMSVLLVLSEIGEVVLVEAAPQRHSELTRFSAIEGKTWNHPVIAHGNLFVRNSEEAACFELPAQ